ncbi:carbohydrate-binding protein [Humibacter ginsenosidimutans]|uniref:Carbohydrate-binding protein n=1 Tax=Humibacter ginsenosidimutans TaxID=2599293 RepID=A0A5B8M712_9MICO|nr:carbohydrate-binding protein [Humibacter ginsenosidimutans]QDZ15959.1 carbohydrate-binding protein [Humibacter ginsenosidimutans]
MNRQRSARIIGLASAAIAVVGGSVLTTLPANAADDATCATAWSASTVYTGGQTASENGVNYTANWWTQGDDPATHSGASGSGQPWTSTGACTTGSTTGGGGDSGGGGTGGGGTGGTGTGTPSGILLSPYKDVTINMNWNTDAMQTAVTGSVVPVVGGTNSLVAQDPKLSAITLAFATGTCGSENWGGVPGAAFASANIPALDSAGVDYVVSTGGAAGTFSCASGSAMDAFIARYASPHMVGVDFDIEGGQTASDISNLVSSAAAAQATYPNLRFSFTLATLASSDGSYGGVNTLGDSVIKTLQASSLKNYTINLMVMDFGRASSTVCVVSGSACDMGQSAIQAVTNLEHTYGVPASQIELTPMIGVNDDSTEVFSLADADTVASYARSAGLAGVHYWSLDRDTPCATAGTTTASPTCNSLSGSTALEFTNRFISDLN